MTTSPARKRLTESIDRLERIDTHSINPQTGQFTRLDQESDMTTDLPRTVITLTGDRGPLHVAKGVLVNGSPVTVAEDGVDIDFGPDEVTTVTLRLLADEVHFVKEAPTETGKPELEWLDEPVPVPHPDEALAKVLHDADSNGHFSWEGTGLMARADYLRMARAARKHIEAEDEGVANTAHFIGYAAGRRKAEADLARVTKERDDWRTKAQRIWNETHSWLATIEPDDGGSMKVTRGRRGALIDTIDELWWSEPFFNPESPLRTLARDDARAEDQP